MQLGIIRVRPTGAVATRAVQPVVPGSRSGRVVAPRSSNADAVRELENFGKSLQQELAATAAAKPTKPAVVMAADVSTAESEAKVDDLFQLNQNTFYEYLAAAGDDLVVVDFYTTWCGPCKAIKPSLVEMNKTMGKEGVRIVGFNCSKENRELGLKLAIKVAPTFHLYRKGQKVAEMTGAKVDKLTELINEHKP